MKALLITCPEDGSWQIALLFLSKKKKKKRKKKKEKKKKKSPLEAVNFKPYIKMINCP